MALPSPGRLLAKVAAPASAVTLTLQSERGKESEDEGRLSSCKDASQKCHMPLLLPPHPLELARSHTTFKRVGHTVLFSLFLETPCLAAKGGFYYYRRKEWIL